MSVRRSKLEITLGVLSAVNNGIDKPTRIMFDAKLSWIPTQEILANLVRQGHLLEFKTSGNKRSRKTYEITEKGKTTLNYFRTAEEMIVLPE